MLFKTLKVLLFLYAAYLIGCTCQLERMSPRRKPDCPPGTHPEKVTCQLCRGSGFLAQACAPCQGTGIVYREVQVGYNRYLKAEQCTDCCGGGNQLHKQCHGQGWVWECIVNP